MSRLRKQGIPVKPVISNPSGKRYALALNAVSKIPISILVNLGKSSVIHATDPSSALALPFAGRTSVVTFHDFIPLLLRRGFGTRDRLFSYFVYKLAASCDAVIAVSQQTKQEIVAYLGVPREKINVIHLGVSEEFKVLNEIEKDEETIGFVGDIHPRKRLDFLLEGFALLTKDRPNARLIVIGSNVAEYLYEERMRLVRLIDKLGVARNVSFVGRVDGKQLVESYNRMKVLVLPSEYEGFGLPILEAERCGTPVIVRKNARISPEISTACLKVDTPTSLADAIRDLLSDENRFRNAASEGLRHSVQFTWEDCVNDTVRLYHRELRR